MIAEQDSYNDSAKANEGYDLYALYPHNYTDGNKFDMLDKLIVVSYRVEQPKLALVPVNGNDIEVATIQKYLNNVYSPLGVNWQVTKTSDFDYEIPKDSLDVFGSGLFSQYTPAMRAMNAAFMQRADYDPGTLYIFVLNYASTASTCGDMPRGQQFGYLFTGPINSAASGKTREQLIGRTVAHEVGHGMFHLKHTFDNAYRITKESTDNLMDYAWGDGLVKHQWDGIHDPGMVIGMFEGDEEGMMAYPEDPIKPYHYFVKDGKINYFAEILQYSAGKVLLASPTIQKMINTCCSPSTNLKNIIFKFSGERASTSIKFIVSKKWNNQDVEVRRSISEMTATTYKDAIICLSISYIKREIEFDKTTYDETFAHELLLHGMPIANEINRLNINKLSYEDMQNEINRIMKRGTLSTSDGEDKDHLDFITGQRTEMTAYIKERLQALSSNKRQQELYLDNFVSELAKYATQKDFQSIQNSYIGGKTKLISDVKKYLKEQFKEYDDMIFSVQQNKTKSLWDIKFQK